MSAITGRAMNAFSDAESCVHNSTRWPIGHSPAGDLPPECPPGVSLPCVSIGALSAVLDSLGGLQALRQPTVEGRVAPVAKEWQVCPLVAFEVKYPGGECTKPQRRRTVL